MERLAQGDADKWKAKCDFGTGEFSPTFVDAGSDATYVDKTFDNMCISNGVCPRTGKPLWFCANHCNKEQWGANIEFHMHMQEDDRVHKGQETWTVTTVHYVIWKVLRDIEPGEELCYSYTNVDHDYPVLYDEVESSLHDVNGTETQAWKQVLSERLILKRNDVLPRVENPGGTDGDDGEQAFVQQYSSVRNSVHDEEAHVQKFKK